jgi:DNA modification methylase
MQDLFIGRCFLLHQTLILIRRITLDDALLNQLILAKCQDVLPKIPDNTFDMIYWDPPYYLRLDKEKFVTLPNGRDVNSCFEEWDKFDSLEQYDQKMGEVMAHLQRVLKPSGSLWASGTYHCAHRIGRLGEDLGMWHFSEVVWVKSNPMPNFLKARPTNCHETLLWFCKNKKGAKLAQRKFKYDVMRDYSVADHGFVGRVTLWTVPLCQGKERIKVGGESLHKTQKPIELISRMIEVCTDPGDLVLDPMGGTCTTAVACKRLRRNFVVIEQNEEYVEAGRLRIKRLSPLDIVGSSF